MSCSALREHNLAIGGMSVCLSVHPSHAGNASKIINHRIIQF